MNQSTADLIPHLNTPFFLFEEEVLQNEIASLKVALKKYWPNYKIGYSVKTNSFPPLASYLQTQGILAEVVSEDEYQLARRIGYTSSELICNGPIKKRSWIEELLADNILLNIDSHREITYVSEYANQYPDQELHIGLRINLHLETAFPNESNAGSEGSRFGFCAENKELSRVIKRLSNHPNITISGLHLHTSTKTRSVEIYRWLVSQFAKLAKEYDLDQIQYIDIGGGFYGGIPDKPNWEDYLKGISDELRVNNYLPESLTLIIEPGASLLAGCFSYFCEVIDVKQNINQHLVTLNGSRIHIDPLMHKTTYFHKIIRKKREASNSFITDQQQLTGFTCLENDRFFKLCNEPLLEEGDIIEFNKVGAYTLTLAPLFITYYPEVYVRRMNGKIECLRKKWGVDEFLQLSKI